MQRANFGGIEKRNQYIGIALVGPNYETFATKTQVVDNIGMDMMSQIVDGESTKTICTTEHIANIKEHHELIEFMTESATIVVDEMFFAANGYRAIQNRYTYVLCEDKAKVFNIIGKERSKTFKLFSFDDIENLLRRHEQFSRNPLVFIGSSKLFKRVHKYIDILRLTKVTSDLQEDIVVCDTFPVDLFKPYFKRHRVIRSEISDKNAKLGKGKGATVRNVEAFSDYIKIVKKVKLKTRDETMPTYQFIEFTR